MSAVVMDPEVAAERYEHGTHARYALGKCRCANCRFAACEYERERRLAILGPWRMDRRGRTTRFHVRNVVTGELDLRTEIRAIAKRRTEFLNARDSELAENQLIDPRQALKHVAKLRAAGIGLKTIALRSGISNSILQRIISGDIKRSRRETVDAILGVLPIARGGAKTDPTETWQQLDDLLARGFTKTWISHALGHKSHALQIKRHSVTGGSAQKVRELHARLEGIYPAARSGVRSKWGYTPPAGARTAEA